MTIRNKLLYIFYLLILSCSESDLPDILSPPDNPTCEELGGISDDCDICNGENFYNEIGNPNSGWDCGINNNECNQVDLCGFCNGIIANESDCMIQDNINIECCISNCLAD